MKEATTERIREYARTAIVDPARRQHISTIKIVAGDVHKALGLNSRVPQVCSALSSRKFQEENNLELLSREGPPSGQSTTVTFVYRLKDSSDAGQRSQAQFLKLRGIAKDVFESLGGGEAFLRRERGNFYTPEPEE